jgi:hypothetical protein
VWYYLPASQLCGRYRQEDEVIQCLPINGKALSSNPSTKIFIINIDMLIIKSLW